MKKFAGKLIPFSLALLLPQLSFAAAPFFPGVSNVVQAAIAAHDVAGAVTVVVAKDKIVHLEASGFADLAAKKPMQPDSLFWIASMTKPVTATAILLLQDEGKLNVNDSVAKYIPEFAALKTPAGQPQTSPSRNCSRTLPPSATSAMPMRSRRTRSPN